LVPSGLGSLSGPLGRALTVALIIPRNVPLCLAGVGECCAVAYRSRVRPPRVTCLAASEDDLRPQVVAASLTAAFNVLSDRSDNSAGKPNSPEEFAARINPVITFLRGGLEALKDQRT